MRVELRDGYGVPHTISTANPDTLAAWLVERIALAHPTDAMPAMVKVWPEIHYSPDHPQGIPDWIADTRIFGSVGHVLEPADVTYLQAQIKRAAELDAADRL